MRTYNSNLQRTGQPQELEDDEWDIASDSKIISKCYTVGYSLLRRKHLSTTIIEKIFEKSLRFHVAHHRKRSMSNFPYSFNSTDKNSVLGENSSLCYKLMHLMRISNYVFGINLNSFFFSFFFLFLHKRIFCFFRSFLRTLYNEPMMGKQFIR